MAGRKKMLKLSFFSAAFIACFIYIFLLQPTLASSSWLPTSEIETTGHGKFTEAFKQLIGKGGNMAMLVILIIALLVFAVSIVNAFWKMRRGDFELIDVGTIVVTGALCALLVLFALHEVESVMQKAALSTRLGS